MRALMFRGPMAIAWEEVETPQLMEPRDALVRPIAVARCDLDPAIALGLYPMPAPFVMGHEMVGEVVAVGEAISNVRLGDKVIVPFQLSCMTCAPCLRGHSNACVNVPSGTAFGLGPHGGIDLGGALAEIVCFPALVERLKKRFAGFVHSFACVAEISAYSPDILSGNAPQFLHGFSTLGAGRISRDVYDQLSAHAGPKKSIK